MVTPVIDPMQLSVAVGGVRVVIEQESVKVVNEAVFGTGSKSSSIVTVAVHESVWKSASTTVSFTV